MTLSWSTPTLHLLFHYAVTSILALRSTPIAMVQAKQCGYQWRSTLILDSHDIHGGYKLWIGCFSHCKRSRILNMPNFFYFSYCPNWAGFVRCSYCILEKHSPDTGTSMVGIFNGPIFFQDGTDCTGNNSGKPLANHLQILGIGPSNVMKNAICLPIWTSLILHWRYLENIILWPYSIYFANKLVCPI